VQSVAGKSDDIGIGNNTNGKSGAGEQNFERAIYDSSFSSVQGQIVQNEGMGNRKPGINKKRERGGEVAN
jgi:hypothetical protein